jgi:hypothetical protein
MRITVTATKFKISKEGQNKKIELMSQYKNEMNKRGTKK